MDVTASAQISNHSCGLLNIEAPSCGNYEGHVSRAEIRSPPCVVIAQEAVTRDDGWTKRAERWSWRRKSPLDAHSNRHTKLKLWFRYEADAAVVSIVC